MSIDAIEAIGANWAGNYRYQARQLHVPRSIAELQDIVRDAERVRALGTRHSFNSLPDSSGDLVSLLELPLAPQLDSAVGQVSISAGARYAQLASFLAETGFALHNMGSLPHISVGGAVSTGTHGSGNANRSLAGAVTALERVGPDGEITIVRRGDSDFDGSVIALGALGIVTRISLEVEPAYEVAQERYRSVPWQAVLPDVAAFMGQAYSVSLFTDWTGDDIELVWLKWRVPEGGAFQAPDAIAGGRPEIGRLGREHDNLTERGGVVGPWFERLPHFRIDATPSDGDEIQTEYFVDMADAAAALSAVRELSAVLAPSLHASEIRSVAADEFWLSPAFGRPSLAIHFTWRKDPEAVDRLIPLVEAALAPFAPRPHWGKAFSFHGDRLAARYPKMPDFRRLVAAADPGRKFSNEFIEHAIGR